jgi:hypothetical protein
MLCNLGEESVAAELPNGIPLWGQRPTENALPAATTLVWMEMP